MEPTPRGGDQDRADFETWIRLMQLRVALTTSDYARLVQFYCTGLGLEPAQVWTNNDDRGLMLE